MFKLISLVFRSEIANETDRLMVLCVHWEPKVEDESIPEESECLFFLQRHPEYVVMFHLVL